MADSLNDNSVNTDSCTDPECAYSSQNQYHGNVKPALHNNLKYGKNNLKIAHLNVHCLEPKTDQIQHYLCKYDIDILALSETFLNDNITDSHVSIDGYKLFRKDRVDRIGGGVAFYVRNGIEVTPEDTLNNSQIEALFLSLKCPTRSPFIICCMYRPPNSSSVYYDQMLELIDASLNITEDIILMGDLNFNYVLDESLSKNPVHYIESLYNLHQLVTSPTRVTPTTSTTLDLILTSMPDNHPSTNVIKIALSDHYLVSTELKFTKPPQKHRSVRFRNYKQFCHETFLKDLDNELKQNFKLSIDLEKSWDTFKESFINVSNKHAPITIRRLKNRCNPWVTRDIVSLMYTRDFYHKKANHDKSSLFWTQYKKYRNKVTREIRKSKQIYFEQICEELRHDGRKLWKNINLVFPSKTKSSILTNSFNCSEINSHFVNVGKDINAKFKDNSPYEMKGPKCIYEFGLPHINETHLVKSLSKFSSCNSSLDILDFDSKLLNIAKHIITPYLTNIFNKCIDDSYVINDFKLARVTPVFKGRGTMDDLCNYRPISVTCFISKVLESHVNKHLMNYFLSHDLITPDQSAFIKHHSTQTSLHKIVDDWLQNIDDKLITGICSLDIAKCFDSLDHDILLQKLEFYGVVGKELCWFKSYLKDRKQITSIDNVSSDALTLMTGIPQGSVLGPLLFIIYANDFPQYIGNSGCNMFADDNILSVTGTNIIEVQSKLQSTVNAADGWYIKNKLSINAPKCNAMTVTTQQKKLVGSLDIKINDITIDHVKSMPYLGLKLDENLLWNEQVSYVAKTVAPKMHCLRRLRKSLPPYVLSKIFKSCIQPHLDYCCTVWGYLPDCKVSKVQHIQNSAARIVTNNFDFINVRGIQLVKDLGWQNFSERRDYLTNSLMFKSIHGLAPNYLSDHVVMMCDVIPYGTRSTYDMNVYVPPARTEYFKRSFQYAGGTLWNSLTDNVKESPTFEKFKHNYRQTYFN